MSLSSFHSCEKMNWGPLWYKMNQGCFCFEWGKPGITVPAHGGIARPECLESCVVGVCEGGRILVNLLTH